MLGYEIGPAGDDLHAVARIYDAVGFRPDLVDDLDFLRRLGEVFVARRAGSVVGCPPASPLPGPAGSVASPWPPSTGGAGSGPS